MTHIAMFDCFLILFEQERLPWKKAKSGKNVILWKKLFPYKATCIWKFIQRPFIAPNLNARCGGYLDKIYKILVDIIYLKAGFPLDNFFLWSEFFCSKTIKSSFFTLIKVANEWQFIKKLLCTKKLASKKPA